jgi:hypothetical protein
MTGYSMSMVIRTRQNRVCTRHIGMHLWGKDIDSEQGVVTLQSFPDILRAFVFIQILTTTRFVYQLVYA